MPPTTLHPNGRYLVIAVHELPFRSVPTSRHSIGLHVRRKHWCCLLIAASVSGRSPDRRVRQGLGWWEQRLSLLRSGEPSVDTPKDASLNSSLERSRMLPSVRPVSAASSPLACMGVRGPDPNHPMRAARHLVLRWIFQPRLADCCAIPSFDRLRPRRLWLPSQLYAATAAGAL